jgi:hypothetical protein
MSTTWMTPPDGDALVAQTLMLSISNLVFFFFFRMTLTKNTLQLRCTLALNKFDIQN